MHLSNDGGTIWIPQGSVGSGGSGFDRFFRTYVDSNDVPAPAMLTLMVLGLLGHGRRSRRIYRAA